MLPGTLSQRQAESIDIRLHAADLRSRCVAIGLHHDKGGHRGISFDRPENSHLAEACVGCDLSEGRLSLRLT
jgi:hypothetical protein